MGQLRVARTIWDALDEKAKSARTVVENNTFLAIPVLDEETDEYVWDDHRLTSEHETILEDVKKLRPAKASKVEDLIADLETKVYNIKKERFKKINPMPSPIKEAPVGDIQVDVPLQSEPDNKSTLSQLLKDSPNGCTRNWE